MSRAQERIKKKLEKNPILECLRIQKKFYPDLFRKFDEVKDPRNQSYIDYSNRVMLGTLFFKSIGGIASMQDMTRLFNDEQVVSNLYSFLNSGKQDYLPHYVTLNSYLERLKPSELEEI